MESVRPFAYPPALPRGSQLWARGRRTNRTREWLRYSLKRSWLERSPGPLGKVIEVRGDLRVGLEPVGPGLLSNYKASEPFGFAGPVSTAGQVLA
jgi:hypothetical protein